MTPVSIVITSYYPDSKKYLDLCVESIRNLDYSGNIDVVIVGRPDYKPQYEGCRTVSPTAENFYPPVGLNCGIALAKHDLMLVLNDDTILTKECLKNMVEVYTHMPNVGLLMPISNDQQGRYCAVVGPMGPMKLDELGESVHVLKSQRSAYPLALMYHDTLCIYAFMISKDRTRAVGPFDEKLINNDDIDYTMRIRQAGLQNAIAMNALIYHFGGVSADHTFTSEVRAEGLKRFQEKWANF